MVDSLQHEIFDDVFVFCVVPTGAPLDSDGDMCYESQQACAEFLKVVAQQ